MASINEVTIDLKFTGLNNLEQATKKMRQVQTEVKRLAKEEKAGAISAEQYSKRVGQLATELQKSTKGKIQARNAVNQYSRQVRDAVKAEEDAKRAVEANKAAQQQLEQVRKRNATIVALQEQRLKEEARAARETAAADAAMAREKERLIGKLNPLRSASMLYEKELNDINRAQQLGVISDRQRQQSLDALNAEFQAFSTGTVAAGNAQNRFAQYSAMSARNTNQLGVLMQQTGYQVGDFAVQVQSGTNVMVALGQQATQLVGTFGMLARSTTMIGVFAGLGIAIPILTAIAGGFMRVQEEANASEVEVLSLTSAISGLDPLSEKVAKSVERNFSLAFENIEKSYGSFVERFSVLAVQDMKDAVDSMFAATETGTESLMDRIITNIGLGMMGQQFGGAEVRDRVEAERQLAEQVEVTLQKYREQVAQANSVNEILNITQQTHRELSAISQEVADNFLRQAKEADVAQKIVENIVKRQEEMRSAGEAARIATEGIASAMRVAAGIDISSPFSKALGFATQLLSKAQSIAEIRSGPLTFGRTGETGLVLDPRTGQYVSSEIPVGSMQSTFGITMGSGSLGPEATGGGRTGGGAAKDPEEEFNRAKAAVDQLVASYDEQYAISLKVAEATKKIEEAQRLGAIPANMEADQILQDYIASLEDAKDPMADFVNNSAKQMADAFTSIVDGSKSASDAFRDMARVIIKQAFEMAVINPIINSIFGGVGGFTKLPSFFADGAAFNKGNVIPFANGGVVNGPTVFPMANGMGLMGEAGPEAVMPLKRGKNGKLGVQMEGGSQQPVVINQSFNFSANGDESVKRIIAQEAPRIANLTQKQILDQRRRGGVMKSTFG